MKPWLRKSSMLVAAFVATATGVVLIVCWQTGIWSWHEWEIYEAMSHECHPVWRDLQAGRIKAGDKIEGVIWRTNPTRIEKFEDVTMLCYGGGFTGVTITAKDGRVVNAGAYSCTWNKTFFDEWDRAEADAFWQRYSAHLNAKWQKRAVEEAAIGIHMAGIGVFP